jgi:hypothetical protein
MLQIKRLDKYKCSPGNIKERFKSFTVTISNALNAKASPRFPFLDPAFFG